MFCGPPLPVVMDPVGGARYPTSSAVRPAVVGRAPGGHVAEVASPRRVSASRALLLLTGTAAQGLRFATEDPPWKDRAMEGASRTAIMTAQFRAAHALVDRDPIFEDGFALALAGCSAADVREFLAANAPDSCAHVVRLFVCQRSRFVEEEVEGAVGSGVDQYVDLGAGLNSFAWRRPDLFEVDHPATQEWKRGRLAATG